MATNTPNMPGDDDSDNWLTDPNLGSGDFPFDDNGADLSDIDLDDDSPVIDGDDDGSQLIDDNHPFDSRGKLQDETYDLHREFEDVELGEIEERAARQILFEAQKVIDKGILKRNSTQAVKINLSTVSEDTLNFFLNYALRNPNIEVFKQENPNNEKVKRAVLIVTRKGAVNVDNDFSKVIVQNAPKIIGTIKDEIKEIKSSNVVSRIAGDVTGKVLKSFYFFQALDKKAQQLEMYGRYHADGILGGLRNTMRLYMNHDYCSIVKVDSKFEKGQGTVGELKIEKIHGLTKKDLNNVLHQNGLGTNLVDGFIRGIGDIKTWAYGIGTGLDLSMVVGGLAGGLALGPLRFDSSFRLVSSSIRSVARPVTRVLSTIDDIWRNNLNIREGILLAGSSFYGLLVGGISAMWIPQLVNIDALNKLSPELSKKLMRILSSFAMTAAGAALITGYAKAVGIENGSPERKKFNYRRAMGAMGDFRSMGYLMEIGLIPFFKAPNINLPNVQEAVSDIQGAVNHPTGTPTPDRVTTTPTPAGKQATEEIVGTPNATAQAAALTPEATTQLHTNLTQTPGAPVHEAAVTPEATAQAAAITPEATAQAGESTIPNQLKITVDQIKPSFNGNNLMDNQYHAIDIDHNNAPDGMTVQGIHYQFLMKNDEYFLRNSTDGGLTPLGRSNDEFSLYNYFLQNTQQLTGVDIQPTVTQPAFDYIHVPLERGGTIDGAVANILNNPAKYGTTVEGVKAATLAYFRNLSDNDKEAIAREWISRRLMNSATADSILHLGTTNDELGNNLLNRYPKTLQLVVDRAITYQAKIDNVNFDSRRMLPGYDIKIPAAVNFVNVPSQGTSTGTLTLPTQPDLPKPTGRSPYANSGYQPSEIIRNGVQPFNMRDIPASIRQLGPIIDNYGWIDRSVDLDGSGDADISLLQTIVGGGLAGIGLLSLGIGTIKRIRGKGTKKPAATPKIPAPAPAGGNPNQQAQGNQNANNNGQGLALQLALQQLQVQQVHMQTLVETMVDNNKNNTQTVQQLVQQFAQVAQGIGPNMVSAMQAAQQGNQQVATLILNATTPILTTLTNLVQNQNKPDPEVERRHQEMMQNLQNLQQAIQNKAQIDPALVQLIEGQMNQFGEQFTQMLGASQNTVQQLLEEQRLRDEAQRQQLTTLLNTINERDQQLQSVNDRRAQDMQAMTGEVLKERQKLVDMQAELLEEKNEIIAKLQQNSEDAEARKQLEELNKRMESLVDEVTRLRASNDSLKSTVDAYNASSAVTPTPSTQQHASNGQIVTLAILDKDTANEYVRRRSVYLASDDYTKDVDQFLKDPKNDLKTTKGRKNWAENMAKQKAEVEVLTRMSQDPAYQSKIDPERLKKLQEKFK